MARQLRAAGEAVGLLAVLDGSPGAEDGRPEENDVDYLLDIAAYVGNFWGRPPEISPERLGRFRRQVAYVAECLAAVEFLPPGTGERQLRQVLAVYRANVQALRATRRAPIPTALPCSAPKTLPAPPRTISAGGRSPAAGRHRHRAGQPPDAPAPSPTSHVLAARLGSASKKTQVNEVKTVR